MTVAVITPWQDHLELAPDYFAAINAAAPVDVVIVDNGSTPPLDFATIRHEQNLGFAAGINAGLRVVKSDIVVLLNNDITMTRPDWLKTLVGQVEPGVLVGPRLRYDAHGDVDGQTYPYLDGWCLAATRADLLELGGMDEGLTEPAYYSDNILAFQARLAGMRLREVRIGLRHKVNQTSGGAKNPKCLDAIEQNQKRFQQLVRRTLAAA